MDTRNPSSSASSSHQWKYDVFLSFRGEDTRKSFTDHLFATLKQKGVFAFRDDKKLEKGKPISPELSKAIEESLFAIVVLSKNYASSTWCLVELVKIMECSKKMGLIVLPIFYDVDPSVVRKQTGTYAQAFEEHEIRFQENIEKVHAWRVALKDVANLSGWSLKDRPESEFIQDIVKMISHKLNYTFQRDTKGLVGVDSQVKELMSLLAIGSNDVRIIGVLGMGGIGKTTLANVVYWKVFSEFEGGCFITNIREVYDKSGLLPLQQKLICDILMEENVNIRDVDEGVLMIKNRLCHKRVLLVLDDVNQFKQLEKLVGEPNWFGQGSRVIITTRDKHLLIRHKVYEIYEARELDDDDALRLFSLKAFNKDHPVKDYLEMSKHFVNYAKGIPLAIDVLGSFLYNRRKVEWESVLDKLKLFPEKDIMKILQISFDGLGETEKEIFLHIACFFNMKDKDYVVEVLDCLGLFPKIGLRVLIEKSLLKHCENTFWMHELLQIMGQDIVRQEPRKWSKLWLYKDIHNVLKKNMECEAIEGLVLELGNQHISKEAQWNLEAFSKMSNLKLLIIHGVPFLRGPKHFSNDLRYLDWSEYPSKSLPSSFQPDELVNLLMCHSKIELLWEGIKHFDNLKSIKLNNSLNLIATPDLSGVPNLEKLMLKGCINLFEVHPSIAVHKKLTLLNLKGCKNLNCLPSRIEMESLEILILSGCSKIKRIPKFMGNMKSLWILHLDSTSITKLPSSIKHLINLASLNLSNCKNLVSIPSSIFTFMLHKDLNVSGCSKLERYHIEPKHERYHIERPLSLAPEIWNQLSSSPNSITSTLERPSPNSITSTLESLRPLDKLDLRRLKFLSISGNPFSKSLEILMSQGLVHLRMLDIRNCSLQSIPSSLGSLYSLDTLYLSGNNFECLPESIIQLSKLKTIDLNDCVRLHSLPQLPSSTSLVGVADCNSLETLPNRLILDKLRQPPLYLFNCFKLAGNQGWNDMFFRMLSGDTQGIYEEPEIHSVATLSIVIPGSEIPRWFKHQSVGKMVIAQVIHPKENVNIQVPSHLCNKWMGMAVCAVFSCHFLHSRKNCSMESCFLRCHIEVNKHVSVQESAIFSYEFARIGSHHLWLLYFHPECFDENARAVLSQIEENKIIQMEVRFEDCDNPCLEVQKCGFRMVYEQDIEDIREMMAPHSKSCSINPYEGSDAQHDFDNSMVVKEGSKIQRSRDNYNAAGPSGEGSSNDVPHSKRIER